MCGIAGIWSKCGKDINPNSINRMLGQLIHRGPDAEGVWRSNNLVLGNRRLKILDLSDEANQPFTDGEDVLVFNGRIFNYRDIREKLSKRYVFKTSCDTEVLFRALQFWGRDALEIIEGQFAFAFFSAQDQKLFVARDHVGIAPLYTYETDEFFYFSSEIKPLLDFHQGRLNNDAVLDYLTFRHTIQNGRTLFKNIHRFAPGHVLSVDMKTGERSHHRYWRLKFETKDISFDEAQDTLNNLLDDQIAKQQETDVPTGLYLSGGIDSGALLSGFSRSSDKLLPFTLQMQADDADVNRVQELSKEFHFKPNIVPLNDNVFGDIGHVVEKLEEPFGDLIICANELLARHAGESLKVVLSGEGGDEAFLGYDHQRAFLKLTDWTSNSVSKYLVRAGLALTPAPIFAKLQSYPGGFGAAEMQKIRRVAQHTDNPADAYLALVSLYSNQELHGALTPEFISTTAGEADYDTIRKTFEVDDAVWKSVFRVEVEQLTLVVNLLKQDRFSMSHSLEGCVPFVAKPILDFAASLPPDLLRTKVNKVLVQNYSGSKTTKKKPFSLFNDPRFIKRLSELMDRELSPKKIEAAGIFSKHHIELLKKEIESGGIMAVKKAMAVLVFSIWQERFGLSWR